MIDSFAAALTLALLVAAAVLGVRLAQRRYRWRGFVPGVVVLQIALILQAILAIVGLARGHRPGEVGPFIAYLVVSIAVLPAAIVQTRDDDGAWAGGLLVLALLALAVIVVREQTTWRSA